MASVDNKAPERQSFNTWINDRFPLAETWERHVSKYYAPKNFNILYMMGLLAMVVLVIQFVSGLYLAMNYKPERRVWLAHSLYALHWRLGLFHSRIPAHVSGA